MGVNVPQYLYRLCKHLRHAVSEDSVCMMFSVSQRRSCTVRNYLALLLSKINSRTSAGIWEPSLESFCPLTPHWINFTQSHIYFGLLHIAVRHCFSHHPTTSNEYCLHEPSQVPCAWGREGAAPLFHPRVRTPIFDHVVRSCTCVW